MDGARFGVIRAVDQAFEPRMNQSAGAHGARLNCNKQFAVFQAMVAEGGTGLAQGDDLGVRCGSRSAMLRLPPRPTIFLAHNDRAYRHFAGFQRSLGGPESLFHPQFVGQKFVAQRFVAQTVANFFLVVVVHGNILSCALNPAIRPRPRTKSPPESLFAA